MKTLKILLVLILTSGALIMYGENTKPHYVKISLEEAVKQPELRQAIFEQVDITMNMVEYLYSDQRFEMRVVHEDVNYLISATFNAWMLLFLKQPVIQSAQLFIPKNQ